MNYIDKNLELLKKINKSDNKVFYKVLLSSLMCKFPEVKEYIVENYMEERL